MHRHHLLLAKTEDSGFGFVAHALLFQGLLSLLNAVFEEEVQFSNRCYRASFIAAKTEDLFRIEAHALQFQGLSLILTSDFERRIRCTLFLVVTVHHLLMPCLLYTSDAADER